MLTRTALAFVLFSTVTALAAPRVKAKSIAKPLVPSFNAPPISVLAPEPDATAVAGADPFEVVHENALSLKVDHVFSKDLARERVSQLLAYWDARFGLKSEWHGFRVFLTGKVLGIAVRALFEIEDADVVARAEDPGTLFSGAARRYVDSKLRKYLHPTYEEP